MAERLTKKISKTIQDKYSLGQYLYYDFAGLDDINKLLNKLGKLEDILEKYGIESVEELEQELKIAHEIERLKDKNIDLNNAIIVFNKNFIKDYIREIEELKVEADTWQKACELASSHISWCPAKQGECNCTEEKRDCTNYFYQQAKKEKDENKN